MKATRLLPPGVLLAPFCSVLTDAHGDGLWQILSLLPPELYVNTKQLSKLKAGMSVSYGTEWISAVLCPSSAVCHSPAGAAAVSLKATLKPLVSDLHQTTLKRINGPAFQLSVNYNRFLGSLLIYKTIIYIWEGPQQEIHNRTFNP